MRENDIRRYGITVLRFKNEEVINEPEKVMHRIADTIATIKKAAKEIAGSSNNSFRGWGKLFVIKIGGCNR